MSEDESVKEAAVIEGCGTLKLNQWSNLRKKKKNKMELIPCVHSSVITNSPYTLFRKRKKNQSNVFHANEHMTCFSSIFFSVVK